LTTPFGTPYVGFKVTIGGVLEDWQVTRTYDDIAKIVKSDPSTFKVVEERTPDGKFKSFSVSTQ